MTRNGGFLRRAVVGRIVARRRFKWTKTSSMYIARYFGQRRRSGSGGRPACSNEPIEARRRKSRRVSRTTTLYTHRLGRSTVQRTTVVVVAYVRPSAVCNYRPASMTAVVVFLLAIFVGHIQAEICPQTTHAVCNKDVFEHRCVCAMSLAAEPAPEQSCNGVVKIEGDVNAASITFNLGESAEHHEEFPDRRFREAVASAIRVDKDQVIMLRTKCAEDNTELIVQFVVKKKDAAILPYTSTNLIDSSSVVTRMKALGHLSQLADLEVIKIEEVEQLVPVEGIQDNMKLALIALVVGIVVIVSCALGVFNVLRTNRYSDIDQAAA